MVIWSKQESALGRGHGDALRAVDGWIRNGNVEHVDTMDCVDNTRNYANVSNPLDKPQFHHGSMWRLVQPTVFLQL
jgi:hypothetical protein